MVRKTDTCWLWTGSTVKGGYGQFRDGGGNMVKAHRFSYEHFVGPVPAGKELMHTCDNPPCVNPEHSVPGTHRQNVRDMWFKDRGKKLYGKANPMFRRVGQSNPNSSSNNLSRLYHRLDNKLYK